MEKIARIVEPRKWSGDLPGGGQKRAPVTIDATPVDSVKKVQKSNKAAYTQTSGPTNKSSLTPVKNMNKKPRMRLGRKALIGGGILAGAYGAKKLADKARSNREQ